MENEQPVVEEVSIDTLPPKEYNEAREKGLTTVPKPAVVEETEETPKESTETPQESQETPQESEEKPKSRGWNGAQKKIDRLTKHNAELEKRAEQAEREREELRAKAGKIEEKPKADDEPKIEDFQTVEEFYRAQGRWGVRQELREQKEAELKAQEESYAKEIFDHHNLTISQARAKYEDFDEVVNATATPWKDGSRADVAASQAFHVAVVESGIGAEILYHYAKNPEELNKLGGLTPAKVQMAIGRLTDKLEATQPEPEEEEVDQERAEEEEKPEPKRKIPAPIRPVGNSASRSSVPLDKMSPADYNKAREAGRTR